MTPQIDQWFLPVVEWELKSMLCLYYKIISLKKIQYPLVPIEFFQRADRISSPSCPIIRRSHSKTMASYPTVH